MERKVNQNIFITLEGGEGAGKTTISHKLAKILRSYGFSVLETSEPGGTAFGEDIRKFVMSRDNLDTTTEALLFAAARHEHSKFLLQTLNEDKEVPTIVICDRYVLSSLVYQGLQDKASGGMYPIAAINANADILSPDRTYFIDVDPEEGIKRTLNRSNNNRFDEQPLSYHRSIYNNYALCMKNGRIECTSKGVDIAYNEATRSFSTGTIVPIDGMNDIDTIVGDILDDIFISMDKPQVVPGDRVEIIRLGNEEKFYGPGDKGTVTFIDDTHSIHVNWDNKGSIALLPECDCWKRL